MVERDAQIQESSASWLADRARRAEEHLKSIRQSQLGPAGRIIVGEITRSKAPPPEERSRLKSHSGGKKEGPGVRREPQQVPLMAPLGEMES